MVITKSIKYICRKCGAQTTSHIGKPPAKFGQTKCPRDKTGVGLHIWVKNQ